MFRRKMRLGPLRILFVLTMLFSSGTLAAGDPNRGASVFQACMACHSVKPDEHMTGPSLANIWGRKAGGVEGFLRYSDAMKTANVVWNEGTLDKWLSNPALFIPHNSMAFPGIQDKKSRQDVIAYLKAVSEGKAPPAAQQHGGMMMGGGKVNLKQADPDMQVISINHCRDTYIVKTAAGDTHKIWEFNLRFKTDSSESGPKPGNPVITGAGMRGDRAFVVFSAPSEISTFVKETCQ